MLFPIVRNVITLVLAVVALMLASDAWHRAERDRLRDAHRLPPVADHNGGAPIQAVDAASDAAFAQDLRPFGRPLDPPLHDFCAAEVEIVRLSPTGTSTTSYLCRPREGLAELGAYEGPVRNLVILKKGYAEIVVPVDLAGGMSGLAESGI